MTTPAPFPLPHDSAPSRPDFPGRYGVPSLSAQTTERHRHLSARVQDLCHNSVSSVALFVIELPGLLEIAEVFGSITKLSLVHDTLVRLAEQFGATSVSSFAEHRLAVVCEDVAEHDLTQIARQIQGCIGCCRSVSGVMIVGTPAIGVALHSPGAKLAASRTEASIEILIRRAELALRDALPGHESSIQLYTSRLDRGLHDATRLRQDLLRAIDYEEFSLAYQPIVDLRENRTSGLEALIRWILPNGAQTANPATIISAAEGAGLIVAIGAQVLETAMAQANRWKQNGLTPPRIAVNVSGQQLQDPEFINIVSGSLSRAGLSPTALEIELTERTLIESSSNTIRLLEYFQGLGVVVSVDDFGTGYSSLRYLQELPISKLKIDRSFISPLTNGAREQIMVQTMINLANGFGLDVVAEGIETSEQLAVLRRLGCSHGQGYLFSRPVAGPDVVACFNQDWSGS